MARHSRLCESLVTAVENGKEVTVLMELRARFDEQNNIEWADRLEDAGCTVIYGSEGFKCHSKICQITYHDSRGISRITCLGTGNFNEKTARLYSDFMLLTAHPGIAEDGNAFFRNLSLGNLRGQYKYLGVAPVGLKPLVMRGIDREINRAKAGQPAQVFMKMNSLTDRDVIDRLAQASQAGVKVILIVRGICCMLPGVKGRTEGIQIRQIVGRLLEHARVYAFGSEADTIYLSSADMMTRNTERRVEICYPILDPTCRDMVIQYMDLQLADNVKARQLTSKGTWARVERVEGAPEINCQEVLIAVAYARARMARGIVDDSVTLSPVLTSLPPKVLDAVLSRSGSTGLSTSLRKIAGHPLAQHSVAAAATTTPAAQAVASPAAKPAAEAESAKEERSAKPAKGKKAEKAAAATAAVEVPVAEAKPAEAAPTQVSPHYIEIDPTPTPEADERAHEAATQLARRSHGRLGTALALFGLGFKALFGKAEK